MIRTLFFLTAILFAFSAQALRLDNCDDETHTIQVDYYGEIVEVTLAPGQRRQLYGRARQMMLGDQKIYLIRPHDEYCVRDGKLKIQRRKRNNKRIR